MGTMRNKSEITAVDISVWTNAAVVIAAGANINSATVDSEAHGLLPDPGTPSTSALVTILPGNGKRMGVHVETNAAATYLLQADIYELNTLAGTPVLVATHKSILPLADFEHVISQRFCYVKLTNSSVGNITSGIFRLSTRPL
jgi:hypothetical protein